MKKKKFLIIGGGLTGLVAALEAGKKGIESLVLEQSFRVGGRLEYGVSFTTSRFQPRIYQLLRELELEDILNPLALDTIGMYSEGKILSFPEFFGFLQTLPQDQQTKINALFGEALQSEFNPENPSPNLLQLREISFGEYLRKLGFSFEMMKMLIEPMLTFTFLEKVDLEKVSAEYGLFHIRFGMEMGQKDVFTFEDGIRILADILKRKLNELGVEVLTETKVVKIKREGEKFRVFTEGFEKREEFEGEKILLALPLFSAQKIIPELKIPEGLSYGKTKVSIVEGKLKFKQKYLLGFPENKANLRFLFPGPSNLFYLYPYFLEKPTDLHQFFTDFSIQEEVEIECAFPIIAPKVHLGMGETNIPNLFVAGDYYYYPFLDTCLFTAQKVVQEIERA